MSEPRYLRLLATGSLVLGMALMATGSRLGYEVKPDPQIKANLPPPTTPGFAPFEPASMPAPKPVSSGFVTIDDWTFIANTTFTGIARRDEGLFFTYDPAQARGKRSCPT